MNERIITRLISAITAVNIAVIICLTVYKTTKQILRTTPPRETAYLDSDDDICTDDWCECACH